MTVARDHREIGTCALCGDTAVLVESHVIPAFVARWIKDTSATGFLRDFHQPNRRIQDFRTVRLLCQQCEGRFSVAEGKFARFLFGPFHAGRTRFQYDDWLLYFAVSLAWRCSIRRVLPSSQSIHNMWRRSRPLEKCGRTFLLGRVNRAGAYRFNLFFTPLGVTSSGQLPEGIAWYLLRAPDGTPLYGKTRTAVYVKLPGMFFWTSVVPPDPGGWRGTKIAQTSLVLRIRPILADSPNVLAPRSAEIRPNPPPNG